MKNLFLISVLLLSISTEAQDPVYFENNQEWQMLYVFVPPVSAGCSTYYHNTYYMSSDTSINSIQDKIFGLRTSVVYVPILVNGCWGDVNHQIDYGSSRFLRQSNDSIYIYNYTSGQEELLISYNVNVGDAFSLTNFVNSTETVERIDTVTINGKIIENFTLTQRIITT